MQFWESPSRTGIRVHDRSRQLMASFANQCIECWCASLPGFRAVVSAGLLDIWSGPRSPRVDNRIHVFDTLGHLSAVAGERDKEPTGQLVGLRGIELNKPSVASA